MPKVDQFIAWAESEGAEVEVAQEDDGSGYTVLSIQLPPKWNNMIFDVTVNE
jgi:hypothetical protein